VHIRPLARAGVLLVAASFAASSCGWTPPPTPGQPTTTTTTTRPAPPGDDFHLAAYDQLAFADEFDGTQLDRGAWCTRYIYGGGATAVSDPACSRNGDGTLDFLNDEQQRYVDTNRNGEALHVVRDGFLRLRATKTRNDAYASYESAMIRSKQLFRPSASTSYYLTARVRLPDVIGTWPAFWLNADRRADGSTTWPPEVDILEGAYNGRDDRADMLHQATIIRGQQTGSGNREYTFTAPEFDRQWNNYNADSSLRAVWIEVGLEWTATGLCYYVDGYKTACENYRWVENGGAQAAPAHVLLNLAIGGNWAGRYGIAAGFPTSFDIDHVRVYRKG
jgi:beta-glucanase (GH16 family)